jgi:nucleotide-binding universal stress UspA family protein
MRYLVALGEDNDAKGVSNNKALVNVALKHAVAGRDCLLLARVVEEVKPDPAVVLLDILCDDDEQIRVEEGARKKLEGYNNQCMSAGVDSAFVVLVDDHAGSALCKAATDHRVDCLVVGRRDLGTIQRLITFSTSKYCVDNAECNVIVVKKPYPADEAPPQDSAQQKTIIKEGNKTEERKKLPSTENTLRAPAMKKAFVRSNSFPASQTNEFNGVFESEERRARMADLEITRSLEERERAERMCENEIECRVRRVESKGNLAITKQMEEEERQRRIAELKESQFSSKEMSANLYRVKQLEEIERQSRIKAWKEEDRQIEDERIQESERDRKLVAKLEEEERAHRIEKEHNEIENEKAQRILERTASLEKVHLAEEQERKERVQMLHDEDIREQEVAEVRSKEDRQLSKRLEEEEKARRLCEDAEMLRERAQQSKLDLLKVKEMEEVERTRRMKTMKVQE